MSTDEENDTYLAELLRDAMIHKTAIDEELSRRPRRLAASGLLRGVMKNLPPMKYVVRCRHGDATTYLCVPSGVTDPEKWEDEVHWTTDPMCATVFDSGNPDHPDMTSRGDPVAFETMMLGTDGRFFWFNRDRS